MSRINVNDIVGKKFNKLTVLEFHHKKSNPDPKRGYFYYYKCQCDCGNITIVRRERLLRYETISCGCYGKEIRKQVLSTKRILSHRLYNIWSSMKARCYNINCKKYPNYGAKGIIICEKWKTDFDTFYDWAMSNGYQNDLTIDRIDVNGNYEPDNCRWTNSKVQANNRTNNHLITFRKETHTLTQWAKMLGLNRSTLWYRLKRGWTIKRALTTPTN